MTEQDKQDTNSAYSSNSNSNPASNTFDFLLGISVIVSTLCMYIGGALMIVDGFTTIWSDLHAASMIVLGSISVLVATGLLLLGRSRLPK